MRGTRGASRPRSPGASSIRHSAATGRAGRGTSPCRPRPDLRPRRAGRGVTAALDPAHPDDRDRERARAPRAPARARPRGPPGRTRRRSRRRATARPGRRGCSAMPRSVLISETASAPCASAAAATSAGDGAVGRQLDDQRLGRARADRVEQRRDLARVGADHQAGLDVRAGDVELERRDLVALAERARPACATSSCGEPMTLTISGTGSSASSGRSCAR